MGVDIGFYRNQWDQALVVSDPSLNMRPSDLSIGFHYTPRSLRTEESNLYHPLRCAPYSGSLSEDIVFFFQDFEGTEGICSIGPEKIIISIDLIQHLEKKLIDLGSVPIFTGLYTDEYMRYKRLYWLVYWCKYFFFNDPRVYISIF